MNAKQRGFVARMLIGPAERRAENTLFVQDSPALPAATAEIMTKACASGQSSVIDRSICATCPGGISLLSRASAPPVSLIDGRPPGKLTTPMSRHHTPWRIPVPSAFEHASLAAKRLA